MRRHIILFVCVVALVGTLVTPIMFAQAALLPLGGQVTTVQPCDTGLLLYVKTFTGVIPVMWLWGELPYMMHVPPHPGQYILGQDSPTPVPCFLGFVPYGAGVPIVFHGDSI